ncbi:hypothetical protein P7K49_035201 [Saguinus oedipus]|uniref:Uncharacterized protein n=1 Tax=Saguinus oedipus TaxID=9490 RepID=A0ABQ9TWZ5_SAGOE|nr:hypothetical protein P7K49_035201 [Saguinus oedipus]
MKVSASVHWSVVHPCTGVTAGPSPRCRERKETQQSRSGTRENEILRKPRASRVVQDRNGTDPVLVRGGSRPATSTPGVIPSVKPHLPAEAQD